MSQGLTSIIWSCLMITWWYASHRIISICGAVTMSQFKE